MRLRMYHVIVVVFVMHTYAQEPPPPLPKPNPQLTEHLKLALEAVFGIGIRLQAFIDEQNENFLVSPISAAVIIGQLALGAEGEFRKQLFDLLALTDGQRYENEQITYYNNNKNISFVLPYSSLHVQLAKLLMTLEEPRTNDSQHFMLKEKSAVFLDKKVMLREAFRKNIKDLYQARLHSVDFAGNPLGTQEKINSWVTKNTNGLITSILASPAPPTTSSIFANAIYFKADWKMPFSDMLNRKGVFNVSPTKTVPVTYMINQLDQILYSESTDYRLIALPYVNEELGMYIILPRSNNPLKYDMRGFIQKLKFREVLDTVSKARRHDVVVKIPKMSLSNSFSILDQLKKYRIFKKHNITVKATNVLDKIEDTVDAFNNFTAFPQRDIYLTGAAVGEPLKVGDIIQQVVITVNEKGTEAAAVSAATIDYMGGAKNFIVERPFVFFIRHEATSATLFWGTVSNPAA